MPLTRKKKAPISKTGTKKKRKIYYKKKLDAVFSQYIRLKYSDANGICRCISCGQFKPWKEIQNGHYMSRRYMATRYSEDNCRPQCVACNIFNQGNIQMYRKNLIAEIGEKRVELVEFRARCETKHYSDFDYIQLIKFYSVRVEMLKKEKGIF